MNMMQEQLLRHANQIATGFCLTLQAIILGKRSIRTKTIMCAQPVYPKAPSEISHLHGRRFFATRHLNG